ncbi:hypothetical protein AYK21_02265 [Thermoplasmatales archaeon SG8-52-2]|nr:MAG: hypothetical protein AYK21_02265 [Thermoplasmatales archaeon SG8-52-2]
MKTSIISIVICLFLLITLINPMTVAIDNVKKSTIPISSGNILYVGGSGSGNYTRIQDAINDAVDGDTVFVFNGTYFENVEINKSIKLIGENRNITIIDGNNIDDVVVINADFVDFSNFTLKNCGNNNFDVGIEILSDYNGIYNNSINNNSGDKLVSGGIFINSSSYNNIQSNTLYDNKYDGITLIKSDFNRIHHNKIFNNKRLGITITNSSNNTIENNEIYENYCGICLYPNSTHNMIKMNHVYNHPCCGIALKQFSNYNKIQYNLIIDNLGHGIMLGPGPVSRNTVEMNTISGCLISLTSPNGAIVLQNAFLNTIKKNNIFDNLINVNLNSSFGNKWLNNYWDNYLGFGPKVIIGWVYLPMKLNLIIPWLNFDWHPANKPYDT